MPINPDLDKLFAAASLEKIEAAQLSLLDEAPFFDVEISSLCQLDCVMCPRSQLRRRQQNMSEALLVILADWAPQNANIMLAGLGEPLLNNRIFSLIEKLKQHKHVVGITTNGILLQPKIINFILALEIDLIQISFNGSSRQLYESIMCKSNFTKVIENLNYLSAVRTPRVDVKLAVTVQEENKQDIANIKEMANHWGFDVFCRQCHSRAGALNNYASLLPHYPCCGIFAKVLFVSSTGDILTCCQDLREQTTLGNIQNQSFKEILAIKREMIKSQNWPNICNYCDDDYRYFLLKDKL